ncbi:MAG: indolepyruvate oxidoreductase subunit beta, partial [Thermodesulfobacteriota bacterium]
LIITGVGGQGNVLASRMVGDMLSLKGLEVTIGETFGASQRGGSVMSHLRASTTETQSPQIPRGQAHMVISLEPVEAVRVLREYGNPAVKVIANMRPVHPISVISGNQTYPDHDHIARSLDDLSDKVWLMNTTREAARLGNPIYSNVIMVGALSATNELPITREAFETVIRQRMPEDRVGLNLEAFEIGQRLVA